MNDIYRDAGKRIYNLRTSKNITRYEIARASGISAKFIYEIETGKKGFSADTLLRIANALSVGCDYILTGRDERSHESELSSILCLFTRSQMKSVIKLLHIVRHINTEIPENDKG